MKKVMPPTHVRMASYGLVRVQMALQNSLTGPRIKKCFKRIGQYPYDPRIVLSQCTTKLTPAQEKTIFNAVPALTVQYDLFGELTTADFDKENIANNTKVTGKAKEDGAINRMRSVCLTHPAMHEKMLQKAPVKAANRVKRLAAKAKKLLGLADGSKQVAPYKPKAPKGGSKAPKKK